MKRRTYIKQSGITIAGVFFSGSLISFLQSCKVRKESTSGLHLFSKEEAALVADLAEMFIPRTDTPGSKDVGIETRIDAVLHYNYEQEDQVNFTVGLKTISKFCLQEFQLPFSELSYTDKTKVLNYLKQDALKKRNDYPKHIYPLIKGLTVLTYFTCEEIANNVLLFDPVPGIWRGDIPIEEVKGMWAIDF